MQGISENIKHTI